MGLKGTKPLLLAHTARHAMEVGFTLSRCANRKEAAVHGRVSNWGEVVTR